MTARDLKDALGPLASVIATEAGWKRGTWNAAVHREQELTDEQRAAYAEALGDHAKVVQKLRRRLRT